MVHSRQTEEQQLLIYKDTQSTVTFNLTYVIHCEEMSCAIMLK